MSPSQGISSKDDTFSVKHSGRNSSRLKRNSVCKAPEPVPSTPPDGGWGWVVVVSSFMISVFVDGMCFSVGIFFNTFLDYFGTTKAETAWVGSVLNGTYLSVGPIVGAFVNRFGCRKMAMMGSIFASLSFFVSTFATSLPLLIFTYGFLGGLGFGFVYLPAIVMVGYYFEKRRALATGIACCGSGVGAFVFAPLCNYLLESYNWKGALWILSGIVLNGLVFSVFYRPLEHQKASQDKEKKIAKNTEPSFEQREALLKQGSDDDSYKDEDKLPLASMRDAESLSSKTPAAAMYTDGDNNKVVQMLDGHGNKLVPSITVTPDISIEVEPTSEKINVQNLDQADSLLSNKNGNIGQSELKGQENKSQKTDEQPEKISEEGLQLRECTKKNGKPQRPLSDIIQTVTPKIHHMDSPETKTFLSAFELKENVSPVARLAFSQDAFGPLQVKKRHTHHGQHHHHHHSHNYLDVDNPLQRRDIFYSGSLRHIPEYQSSENIQEYRRKVMTVEEVGEVEGSDEEEGVEDNKVNRKSFFRRIVCDPLLHVFDVTLLRSPTFVIYGLSCFLCMLGFFVPFIYLPTLCIDLGMGSSKAAFLISFIGIANTIGRVVAGFVSDQPWADCLLINNVALVIGGVSTCCVPFLSIYPLFATYTFLFGTCIAVFVSLRSIIMVELLGLQKLTNAFGLVIMCQGISSFIGAPIAGMLSDFMGDYNIAFYVAGIFLGLAGVICFPLRRIARWEAHREQENKNNQENAQNLQ